MKTKDNSLYEQVRLLSLTLGQDTSSPHVVCPKCGGGLTSERSFVITRIGGALKFLCHRATCGWRGIVGSTGVREEHVAPTFEAKEYPYPTEVISPAQERWLVAVYGISVGAVASCRVRFNTERQTYAFPILDYRGYEIGIVDRDFTGIRKPKAISYWFNDVPKLYYAPANPYVAWQGDYDSSIIIVEDILSALKCSMYGRSVALLGTHISEEQALALSERTRNLIIVLDPDATRVALKHKKKYQLMFDNIDVVRLDRDPKDTAQGILFESIAKIKAQHGEKHIKCANKQQGGV